MVLKVSINWFMIVSFNIKVSYLINCIYEVSMIKDFKVSIIYTVSFLIDELSTQVKNCSLQIVESNKSEHFVQLLPI